MKNKGMYLCLAWLLVGCNTLAPAPTSTPTVTNTPTATATYTPSPTSTLTPTPTPVPLEGRLFFDMNGSGLQDQASFSYDPARLTDARQPLQPDLLKAITAYAQAHPELKKGNLATIEEPALSGYKVCVGDSCGTTDADGKFSIADPGASPSPQLVITDPNAGTPALEMRFKTKWNGPITIPAYTKDLDPYIVATMYDTPLCAADAAAQVCKQDADTVLVREQQLNDTEVVPLNKATPIKIGQPNDIGLMQGYLVMPIRSKDDSKLVNISYFDHDSRPNAVLIWDGSTQLSPLTWAPTTCRDCADDGHDGIDFWLPDGTLITASIPSVMVDEYVEPRMTTHPRAARLDNSSILIKPGYYTEIYLAHESASLVELGQQLYPGEITLISNHTGTGSPHLHFSIVGINKSSGKRSFVADPYGVLFDTTTESDRYSAWTVYNLPIYPQ